MAQANIPSKNVGSTVTAAEFNSLVTAANSKSDYVPVSTYAAMVALPSVTVLTTIKVAVDENKGQTNTIYQIWPDGTRMWVAAVKDN